MTAVALVLRSLTRAGDEELIREHWPGPGESLRAPFGRGGLLLAASAARHWIGRHLNAERTGRGGRARTLRQSAITAHWLRSRGDRKERFAPGMIDLQRRVVDAKAIAEHLFHLAADRVAVVVGVNENVR